VRTRLTGSALLAASLAVSAATAAPRDAEPKNAVSYAPLAILSRGFLIQYERLVTERIGVVLGPGVRFAAREDFESETLVVHTEGRYWLVRRELISKERGMVGPFAALSADLARTSLESLSLERSLGAMWTLQESVRFGYRFVIFGFQEITPSFGLGMVHEFDEEGRLAATTRLTLGANLTVGWLF
jgi:hypothetical protein